MPRKKKPGSKLGHMLERFRRLGKGHYGTSSAFIIALTVILTWGITGPIFHFSDTWQLVINTGTTIVTFLMVFLIQRWQKTKSVSDSFEVEWNRRGIGRGQQSADRCRRLYRGRRSRLCTNTFRVWWRWRKKTCPSRRVIQSKKLKIATLANTLSATTGQGSEIDSARISLSKKNQEEKDVCGNNFE